MVAGAAEANCSKAPFSFAIFDMISSVNELIFPSGELSSCVLEEVMPMAAFTAPATVDAISER